MVVVPRVVQLMAPGVVERGSSISSTGGSGAAGGIPVRRHPAYEQVEGPPLLEPVE